MKTTLDLNDELLVRAKALSAREHKSLTRLIEEGLQLRLRGNAAARNASPHTLAIYHGTGGLKKGLNPLSNRALLDAADDDT